MVRANRVEMDGPSAIDVAAWSIGVGRMVCVVNSECNVVVEAVTRRGETFLTLRLGGCGKLVK